MRYLFFSDAHGNAEPVREVFRKADELGVDQLIFCGDIFGYFFDAPEIIDLLRSNHVQCLKGNHDDNYLRSLHDRDFREEMLKTYGSSYATCLREAQIKWLENLSVSISVQDELANLLIVHGTPQDPLNGRLYPDTDLRMFEPTAGYDYIIMGHTHYRLFRDHAGICLMNPGSIGQPRDSQGCSFMILDTEKQKPEFYRVGFDKEKMRGRIETEEVYSIRNKAYLLKKIEEM